MIPEVGSYLISAIAGGVLSFALKKEKIISNESLSILKDCGILLLISFLLFPCYPEKIDNRLPITKN
jgi:hypothetical protein